MPLLHALQVLWQVTCASHSLSRKVFNGKGERVSELIILGKNEVGSAYLKQEIHVS